MSCSTAAHLASLLVLAGSLAGPVPGRASDCNANGADDIADIASGASRDCNSNLVPDECELRPDAIAYEARLTFPTGFASSIAAEDFDGDGDLDLVASEFHAPGQDEMPEQDRAVVFLRNLGGGRFGTPERYQVTDKPYTAFPDDLDADGDLDLIVRLAEIGELWVYLNDGPGTFGSPTMYKVAGGVGSGGRRKITADIDGDGDPDMVLSAIDPGRLATLVNRGDGSFLPGPTVPVDPHRLELADLDGDGDLDIALNTDGDESSEFVVLLNDGAGSFPGREDHDLGAFAHEVALADLDADGDLDFLTVRGPSRPTDEPREVAVFHNRGDGRFDPAPSLHPGHTAYLLRAADLDGDGDADVLSASDGLYGDRESVAIFLNDGAGAFSRPALHVVGDHPTQIEIRDLNGDARPDILVINYFGGSISVLRNAGGGRFDDAVEFRIIGGPGPYMASGDVDGDGDIDVVTASFSNDQSIGILENITGGEFKEGCREFLRGDVNADGVLSLADIIMLRRYLFDGAGIPSCFDSADASDNDEVNLCDAVAILDVLFRNPGWTQALPAPSFVPGPDPTPLGVEPAYRCDSGGARATLPLGCLAYDVEPPVETSDLLRIGDAAGVPGATVQLPIHLSTTLSVDAVQLVIGYDPAVLEVDPGEALDFEGTYFDRFEAEPFHQVSVDAANGLLVAGIAGDLILSGREIAPGDDILIARLNVRVKDDAPSGRVPVDLSNGPDDAGVGPYHLRNEITHRGEARFASFIPDRIGAILAIVGDQTLFLRGDSNDDGKVNLSDAVYTLGALFTESGRLACEDAGDANDDGRLNISDPIFTLEALFNGGRAVPQPFPDAGADPTPDGLHCF